MPKRTAAPAVLAASVLTSLFLAACSATPSPTPRPTPSPSLTAPPALPTPLPSGSPQGQLAGACLLQVNQPEGAFSSYEQATLNWDGPAPQKMLLIVDGTNDDQAVSLAPDGSVWSGHLGARQLGQKTISSLFVVYSDGSGADLTETLTNLIGGSNIVMEVGKADAFGNACST